MWQPCRMHVVVLGAGFGGLEITATLSEEFGDGLELTLVDRSEGFVFGFSKFDLMFGHADMAGIEHRYADLVKPGVRFLNARVESIDPVEKVVVTDSEELRADILVIALGADLDLEATPGLIEGGNEFYSVEGAAKLRDLLPKFEGGRVLVGVTSAPFKCPPAPSEAALLMHEYLEERGLLDRSEISLVMPLGAPIPPAPAASKALLAAFEQRGIHWHAERGVRSIDPERKVARLDDGSEMPFDLYLGVPVHQVPAVVESAGMTVDGWVPVDPLTLETSYPDVFAVGDVTSVGTPKAGVFAEGQGAVVAKAIAARLRSAADESTYDGHAICYVEFGSDAVGQVDVTFPAGGDPSGTFVGPSASIAEDKVDYGATRIERWFGRSWEGLGRKI